jgi:hypothetical protein
MTNKELVNRRPPANKPTKLIIKSHLLTKLSVVYILIKMKGMMMEVMKAKMMIGEYKMIP